MSSLIEKLLSKAKATTAEAIRAEESKAERALHDARAALARAKAGYTEALLDDRPEASARARAIVTEQEIAVERAEALATALRARFLQACETESSREREEHYEAAKRALAEAEQKVSVDYPKVVTNLLKLIEVAAEALHAVQRANENLPDGEMPIQIPPCFGGQTPAKPELILNRELVEKWTFESSGKIVGEHHEVVSTGLGRGIIEGAGRNPPVIIRRFQRVSYHPVEAHGWKAPFFQVLCLPKLDDSDYAHWRGGADEPEALLEEVRQSLAALRSKPAPQSRPIHSRLEPI